jgi:hypothetical protein
MLDISDEAFEIMSTGGYTMTCRVESWRGDDLLADDIPIGSGTETVDVTQNVPESLTITVPRLKNGVTWAPGTDIDHPLAPWGQRLRVYLAVQTSQGFEGMARGWFYIVETDCQDETVSVTASGLLGLIDEADFISPYSPSGNFTTIIRQLIEPELLVDFTNAPTDRAVPANTVQDGGRLDALYELLTAWGATAFVDETGTLQVVVAGDTSTSSLSLTDGAGGTAMKWGNKLSRDGAASAVVARGYDSTGADVQAVANDNDPASPTYINGPFNSLPVPYDYFSPLLTTVSQCQAAANTVLFNRRRQASRTITTTAVPMLALQTRDGVTVTSDDLNVDAELGIVDQLIMPLTPGDGGMTLGVRVA